LHEIIEHFTKLQESGKLNSLMSQIHPENLFEAGWICKEEFKSVEDLTILKL